jgi:outer membrane protein assembly factor BamB
VVADWKLDDLPDAFADLVVSEDLRYPGSDDCPPEAIARVVKADGGRVFFKSNWTGGLDGFLWNTSDFFAHLDTPSTTGTTRVSPYHLDALARYAQERSQAGWKVISQEGGGLALSCEKTPEAGAWTSLYGNVGNTACSADEWDDGPLGVQWFEESDASDRLASLGRAESPLAMGGRVFFLDGEKIVARDIANGTRLWERELPGVLRIRVDVDGGNLSLTRDGLFAALPDRCLRLDPLTGHTVSEYPLPGGNGARWGFLQAHNGRVWGSVAEPLASDFLVFRKRFRELGRWPTPQEADDLFMGEEKARYESFYDRYVASNPNHPEEVLESMLHDGEFWLYEEGFPSWDAPVTPAAAWTDRLLASDTVFALDVQPGQTLWTYRGRRIPNTALALDGAAQGGRLFLVEEGGADVDRSAAVREVGQLVATGVYCESDESLLKPAQRDVRRLVALEADTGKVLWKKTLDLTGCGGDRMELTCARGLVLFYGHYANEDHALFRSGKLAWRRVTAVSAETGRGVWSRPLNYRGRPVVVGDTLVAQPRLFDLETGKVKMRKHPVSGEKVEWGMVSTGGSASLATASSHTLCVCSDFLSACDLRRDEGATLSAGENPGAWVQAVPVCGGVFLTESGRGGVGPVALRPTRRLAPGAWGHFVSEGTLRPVQRLAINLGAPGDKREIREKDPESATLWLAYPRPVCESNGNIALSLSEETWPGLGFFAQDESYSGISGTERPWLYTSGCLGFLGAKIPLLETSEETAKPAEYLVRLGFRSFPSDRKHKRVFDIALQGVCVASEFDPVVEADGPGNVLVKEFPGVEVRDSLEIRFTPRIATPTREEAPILNYIELIRTR